MPVRARCVGAHPARRGAVPHRPRWALRGLLGLAGGAALLLGPVAARADVSSPGERIVPSDVVFTGLVDFPAYRFVVAAVPIGSDLGLPDSLKPPTPAEVREGEPLSTSTVFFQELRAIPADAPQGVTDAWLATSKAPTSGSFSRRPLRVPEASGERLARVRYRVRQVKAGWVSLELLSTSTLMADGSEKDRSKPIPRSYEITALEAPPGWTMFLMPNPSWPREGAAPAVPCAVGDVLPLSPGPRTLVAMEGTPGADGSVAGQPFVAWGGHMDPWVRDAVPVDSAAVASKVQMELQVEPGSRLGVTVRHLYQDAQGRWFDDEEARLYPFNAGVPVDASVRWAWWGAAGGAAIAAVATGFWVLRRRRRAPAKPPRRRDGDSP